MLALFWFSLPITSVSVEIIVSYLIFLNVWNRSAGIILYITHVSLHMGTFSTSNTLIFMCFGISFILLSLSIFFIFLHLWLCWLAFQSNHQMYIFIYKKSTYVSMNVEIPTKIVIPNRISKNNVNPLSKNYIFIEFLCLSCVADEHDYFRLIWLICVIDWGIIKVQAWYCLWNSNWISPMWTWQEQSI